MVNYVLLIMDLENGSWGEYKDFRSSGHTFLAKDFVKLDLTKTKM